MKKLISIFLILTLVLSLAACAGQAKPADPSSGTEKTEAEKSGTEKTGAESSGSEESGSEMQGKEYAAVDDFEGRLLEYVLEKGYESENCMISALSFKAVLCLAAEGASGATQKELLAALGFSSVEEMENWYASVNAAVKAFAEQLREEQERYKKMNRSGESPDRAFELVNSIWNNLDSLGVFREEYKKTVEEKYGAAAYEVSADEITDAVNKWCSDNTNGMIPKISDDLSEAASVLVNALYVRAPWVNSFEEGLTHEDIFTDKDGKEITKEFMEQTNDSLFYEDEKTRIVVIPMEGDLQFVAVLGEKEGFEEKLRSAAYEKVHIMIPKMDFESTFDGDIMIGFLKSLGVESAWSGETADFSAMSEEVWYIDDIIQKTKIKTDEEGLEAAAVTAVMIKAAGMPIQEEAEIKEFIADEPFSFFIYSGLGGEAGQLLFAGQYVK